MSKEGNLVMGDFLPQVKVPDIDKIYSASSVVIVREVNPFSIGGRITLICLY